MVYIETPYHTSDLPEGLRIDLLAQMRSAEYYKARVARVVSDDVRAQIKDKTDVSVEDRFLLKHDIKDPAHPKLNMGLFLQVKSNRQLRTLLAENYKASPPPISLDSISCIDMCYENKKGVAEVACGVQSTVDDADVVKSIESTLSDWLRWIGDDAYALLLSKWEWMYSDAAILDYCEKERVVYRPKDEALLIPSS